MGVWGMFWRGFFWRPLSVGEALRCPVALTALGAGAAIVDEKGGRRGKVVEAVAAVRLGACLFEVVAVLRLREWNITEEKKERKQKRRDKVPTEVGRSGSAKPRVQWRRELDGKAPQFLFTA